MLRLTTLVIALCLAAPTAAAQQQVYWRDTDPNGQSPKDDPYDADDNPDGWRNPGTGNTGQVPIQPGKSIYFGIMNKEKDIKKTVNLKLTWLRSKSRNFSNPKAWGYVNGQKTKGYIGSSGSKTNIRATWDKCPAWEYIELTNFKRNPHTVQIKPSTKPTKCLDTGRSASGDHGDTEDTLEIVCASFGVQGEMTGPLGITRLELYPERSPIDLAHAPFFEAPPHTGNWSWNHSYADPTGRPRPGGGFVFTSDGPGLDTDDIYSASIRLDGLADTEYTVFAFNAQGDDMGEFLVRVGDTPWYEGFDDYAEADELHGNQGWRGWDDDPAFSAPVTQANGNEAPGAADISGNADIVRPFEDADSGLWSFEAWQYIPFDFETAGGGDFAGSYFILLNTYQDGGPHDEDHWSVQMQFDSRDGLCKVFHGDGTDTVDVPYITDRWVKIEAIVDLENDWTQIYYDGALVTEYSWTGGVLGDGAGALDVAAVDLYAQGSSSVFYDDLLLVPIEIDCPADFNGDGDVNTLDVLAFLNAWNASDPSADFNGDGDVNTLDVLAFLNAWTAGC